MTGSDDSLPFEKRCSQCGEMKSLDKFWKQNGGLHGRASACKECRKKEPARGRRPCSVVNSTGEQCQRDAFGRNMCSTHYDRWRKTGDVRADVPIRKLAPPGSWRLHAKGGYKSYVRNGQRIFEHRIVMEEILGRPLVPGENVHHRNGDRLDNSPENLELWYVSQPYGQRAQDLVEYVAKYHANAVLEALGLGAGPIELFSAEEVA